MRLCKQSSGKKVGCACCRLTCSRSGSIAFAKDAVDKCAEFQFTENLAEFLLVGFFAYQAVHVECDGSIGLDGGQEFGESDHFAVRLYFGLQGSFQLVGVFEQIFDAAELGYQLLSGFLAHAGTTGYVVRYVAHQAKHVDDLRNGIDAEFSLYLVDTHYLEAARVLGAVHEDVFADQLSVVFVGRHHVGGDALSSGFGGQCAYYVIGFVARHLQNGDAVGTDDVFYNRYGEADGFGRFFALRLVLFVGLVSEGGTCGVEGDSDVGRVLFLQDFFQRVYKTQYGGCIEAFGVDSRVLDKRIIGPIYQGISVEKE